MAKCATMSSVPTHGNNVSTDWSASVDELDLQEQRDEVMALQSIYEGNDEERIHVASEPDENGQGLFEIEFTVPVQMVAESCQIDIWMPSSDGEAGKIEEGAQALAPPPNINRAVTLERSQSGQRWTGSFKVKNLSPLTLHVTFPPRYPSHDAPSFTLSCVWLSCTQLSALCRQLDNVWEQIQGPIVYTWIDWLENQALSCLDITDSIALVPSGSACSDDVATDDNTEDDRALPECWDLGQAIHTMVQYSNGKEAVKFCLSVQECCLCFDEKMGTQFFRLHPCKHHFCFECLATHCQLHVTAGTIQLLMCPSNECKAAIQPDVLQAVLSAELFKRWGTLSLQRTLDEMDDIVYCPRCQSVVIREQEETLNLGHCLACYYSFCTQCEQPWHQGSVCQSEMERLEAHGERLQPGNKAARERYEELKKRAEEMVSSVQLIKRDTVNCPKCKIPIQKIAGCNKMTCQCGQAFCWLCKKAINGYEHFQGTGAACSLMTNVITVAAAPRKRPPDAYLWIQAQMETMPDAKERTIWCVGCKQDNLKTDNNNHLRCWNCKAHLCFVCRTRITGVITRHFSAGGCPQHS